MVKNLDISLYYILYAVLQYFLLNHGNLEFK